MRIFPKGLTAKQFFKDLWREINEDRVLTGAAALAYFLTLAIFPALIFVLSLLPFLPVPHLDQAIMDTLRQALPGDTADLVKNVVTEITSKPREGLLSFGFLATLWAASSGTKAVMDELNVTYDVVESRSFFKARGVAVALTIGLGILMILAFLLVVLGEVLHPWLARTLWSSPSLVTLIPIGKWVIIVGAILLAYAVAYYFGPDVEQKFKYITPGSIFGTFIMILACLGYKVYVSNFSNFSATYGSIGAVIGLMLWLYIGGIVLLLGSEINALIEHYSAEGKEKGEKSLPKEGEKKAGKVAPPTPATTAKVRSTGQLEAVS